MSELDSVGMSFGKATEGDVSQYQTNQQRGGLVSLQMLTNTNNQNKNQQLLNMNRQHKSDRNVFAAGANAVNPLTTGGVKSTKKEKASRNRLSPLQEMESEFVLMGELLQNSQEKQALRDKMTENR